MEETPEVEFLNARFKDGDCETLARILLPDSFIEYRVVTEKELAVWRAIIDKMDGAPKFL